MTLLATSHFIQARAAMGRRLSARRAARFDRPVHGSSMDSADMLIEVDDPPAPPIAFHLIYQDAKNQLTGRCFTLRKLREDWNEVHVGGICHYRNAYRTFLGSRVVEVTDLATGEVFEDGVDYFSNHPLLVGLGETARPGLSPDVTAVQDCRDEIIILSFVAGADDDFSEAEEDAIVGHVLDRACDPDVSEAEVRRRIRAYLPDEMAFDRALQRLCDGAGNAISLMRTMRRVIDADGEIDMEEVAFADEVQSRLASAGRL